VARAVGGAVVGLDLDQTAAKDRPIVELAAERAAEEIAGDDERGAAIERRLETTRARSTHSTYPWAQEVSVMKKPVLVALAIAAAAAAIVFSPAGSALSQEMQSVIVTNFPKLWKVNGSVSIDGPVSHARFFPLREVTVPPVSPKDTVRLIQGGIVESDGFTSMVLGLQGQIKGEVYRQGTVGVFLLPDEESIVKVFEEKGLMQFSTEVNAPGVSGASPYFTSTVNRIQVAFPRYRTYFYNTSDKTVTVNLFAYLTN
jgi:hypothetical protein